MIRILTVKDVEYLAFVLARERLTFNEPIPDFSTRYPNLLESCLATPFQTFGKKDLYPTLISKASILFYLMNKNHPFQNGNKRIAITTLLVFLYKNKKWLELNTKEFYNFAVWIAESPPIAKRQTVEVIEEFIAKFIIDFIPPAKT
jgi:death-on-curing protein